MKKITIMLALVLTAQWTFGQNTYKTDFANNAGNRIKIDAAPEKVTIIGHDKNEIIIEMISKPEQYNAPKPKSMNTDDERSKGLKPLTSTGPDNTGIGLSVEKTENQFVVQNMSANALGGEYIFRIPNKVKLTVNEIKPWTRSSYNISGLLGELNITGLNSGFVIKDVSGPVVLQSTNGNIDIAFNKLAMDKPNSLTTVNGYIDITIPSNTKADFKINAVNGEAFTDFEIKAEANRDGKPIPMVPNMNIFNLSGSINGGGAPFNISAVNGNVYIRKGN